MIVESHTLLQIIARDTPCDRSLREIGPIQIPLASNYAWSFRDSRVDHDTTVVAWIRVYTGRTGARTQRERERESRI